MTNAMVLHTFTQRSLGLLILWSENQWTGDRVLFKGLRRQGTAGQPLSQISASHSELSFDAKGCAVKSLSLFSFSK